MYELIGKQVRVHLYTAQGIALGTIRGRVADVAAKVEVVPGMNKDLVYVVDIKGPAGDTTYVSSSGVENEGWFAVQDLEIVECEGKGQRAGNQTLRSIYRVAPITFQRMWDRGSRVTAAGTADHD